MRILHLIPSLGHDGASRQLELVASGLHEHEVEVCQFAPSSPASERLRQAGIVVHSLGWNRLVDPISLWRLHKILRDFRPELVHAWHRRVLRPLAALGGSYLRRAVVSRPFSWDQHGRLSQLDRWLLSKVARVVVHGDAEASLAKNEGLYLDRIAVIPPGTPCEHAMKTATDIDWSAWPRKIVCVGPLERHKGFRQAIWAFDFLFHIFPDLHLFLVGDGADRPFLERRVHDLERSEVTHFVGAPDEVAGCLAQADVCWIPSRRGGGSQVALEAMLSGNPVIASKVPSLEGLIVDGHTGFCVPPNDSVALARRTRQLLLDCELGLRLGRQARQRVQQHFSASLFVRRCLSTYEQVAA